MNLSPQELDAQCQVKIDKWIDVNSEECQDMDDYPAFTKKILRLGFQDPPFLFTDSMGRIFGKGEDGHYYPFHFEYGSQKIGMRIAAKAAN